MVGPPKDMLLLPYNRRCADCAAFAPRWASVNLGVFICEACSGIHRRLGAHISQVRSVSLDEWRPEWIRTMRRVGNARAKAFFEHAVPDGEHFIGSVEVQSGDRLDQARARDLEKWIRAKYEELRFAPQNEVPPHLCTADKTGLEPAKEPGASQSSPWPPMPAQRRSAGTLVADKLLPPWPTGFEVQLALPEDETHSEPDCRLWFSEAEDGIAGVSGVATWSSQPISAAPIERRLRNYALAPWPAFPEAPVKTSAASVPRHQSIDVDIAEEDFDIGLLHGLVPQTWRKLPRCLPCPSGGLKVVRIRQGRPLKLLSRLQCSKTGYLRLEHSCPPRTTSGTPPTVLAGTCTAAAQ